MNSIDTVIVYLIYIGDATASRGGCVIPNRSIDLVGITIIMTNKKLVKMKKEKSLISSEGFLIGTYQDVNLQLNLLIDMRLHEHFFATFTVFDAKLGFKNAFSNS
jgi:hypothetical protein